MIWSQRSPFKFFKHFKFPSVCALSHLYTFSVLPQSEGKKGKNTFSKILWIETSRLSDVQRAAQRTGWVSNRGQVLLEPGPREEEGSGGWPCFLFLIQGRRRLGFSGFSYPNWTHVRQEETGLRNPTASFSEGQLRSREGFLDARVSQLRGLTIRLRGSHGGGWAPDHGRDFWAGTSARTKRASCPRGKEKVGRLLGPQSFPYLLAVHSWAMHCTFPRLDVFTIWRVVTALGHAVVVITC